MTLTATVAFRHPTIEALATVIVEGDVSPKDVLDALHKAGFNATVK